MPKKTLVTQVLFGRIQRTIWLCLFLAASILLNTFLGTQSKTEAAAANTINFQARLLQSSGAVVPDGYYNAEFKLYNVSSGGSALWTETYYDSNGATAGNDNRVRVANGYLTVNLNALNNNWGSITDWDQQMWLTMNIGGVTQTATPTWDGEMSPRLKLTSVPYAFQSQSAAQLQQNQGGNTGTLGFDTLTGNRSIELPDEDGTVCLQGKSSCGFAASSGSSNYIQNGTSPQTADFNITGDGTVGGALTANGVSLFKNSTDSGLAFGIQNSAGIDLFGADTVNKVINIGSASGGVLFNDDFDDGDLSSWTSTTSMSASTDRSHTGSYSAKLISAGGTSYAAKGITSSNSLRVSGYINIDTASTDIDFLILKNGTHTFTVYYNGNFICMYNGYTGTSNCDPSGTFGEDSWQKVELRVSNGLPGVMQLYRNNVKVVDWATNTGIIPLDEVQIGNPVGSRTATVYIDDVIVSGPSVADTSLSVNGDMQVLGVSTFSNDTSIEVDSGTAFQIQNGAGSGNLFVADTVNSKIGIGTLPDADGAALQVVGGLQLLDTSTPAWSADLEGAIMYDSSSGKFYVYDGTAKKEVCNQTDALCGGNASTLQDAYDASTDPEITVDATRGALTVRDASSAIGANLFEVQSNNRSISYLSVAASGTTFQAGSDGVKIQDQGGNTVLLADANNSRIDITGDLYSKGLKWTSQTPASDRSWNSITYGNGLFVAVSSTTPSGGVAAERVMTSPDGVNWTARTAAAASAWNSVTYGNGLFVAVGASGAVMTSPDGITWTSRTAAAANTWNSVTYGKGLFVAVSSNATGASTERVMTSPDGVNWTIRTAAAASSWWSITYGNGLFVAVSSAGLVMTSPDGTTWTSQTAAAANSWWSITYGNGLFVAVSLSGTNRVMTSPDGVNWTSRSAAVNNNWTTVSYGNGLFVAVANNNTSGPQVMTSPDGINWTSRTAAANKGWSASTYGNGMFVVMSSNTTLGTNLAMTSGKVDYIANPTNNIYQGGMTTYGNSLFKSDLDSTTTFQIQNAAGNNYLLVNTSGTTVELGNTGIASTVQIGNNSGNVTQTINIGNNTTGTSNINIGNSAAGTVAVTGPTTITNRTSGSSDTFVVNNSSSTGVIAKFQDNGVNVFSLADGGAATLQNTTNSTSAFQIQNAASTATLLNVDTTTSNLITNPSFEAGTTGWAVASSGTGLAISQTTTAANVYHGLAALQTVTASSAANTGAAVTGFNASLTPGTYTLSFIARATTSFSTFDVTITGGGAPTCLTGQTLTTGFQRYSCTFTTSSANISSINFITTTSTQRTFYIDAVQILSGSTSNPYTIGKLQLNGVITSPTIFQNASDSTVAFSVQNASGSNVITADTVNTRVLIGSAATPSLSTAQLAVTIAEVQTTLRVGNATNGFSFNDATTGASGQLRLYGTARNTKKLVLTPEFAGAVLDGSGTGTMTAGYDGTQRTNYYKWTTTQGSSQTYDVVITMSVPSDWSAWATSNAISVSGWTSNTTNSTGALTVIGTSGTTDVNATSVTPGSTSTWTTTNANLTSANYAADGTMVIKVRMAALSNSSFQLGNITLTYLSQF